MNFVVRWPCCAEGGQLTCNAIKKFAFKVPLINGLTLLRILSSIIVRKRLLHKEIGLNKHTMCQEQAEVVLYSKTKSY